MSIVSACKMMYNYMISLAIIVGIIHVISGHMIQVSVSKNQVEAVKLTYDENQRLVACSRLNNWYVEHLSINMLYLINKLNINYIYNLH